MSDTQVKTVLIKLKPKNTSEEIQKLVEEFKATDVKLDGMISLPETHMKVTDEGHLLFLFPNRMDFAVAMEPDEFQIMAEKE